MADEENLGVLQTVRELRRREPFIPFRLVMRSGESYTVENSELLAIGASQRVYCMAHSDRVVYLRLSQLTAVDDIGRKSKSKKH